MQVGQPLRAGPTDAPGACDGSRVIPTTILAGLVLGLRVRWWAIPMVAMAWAIVIAFIVDMSSALAGGVLGGVNASVGVLVAVGLRKLFHVVGRRHRPSRAR